jgi:hypothetical protein
MFKKGLIFTFFFYLFFAFSFVYGNSNTFSQTKTLVCSDIGGCKNATFFECKENECKPISDGKLKITIKGDYNMSYPQRESLQMDVENGYLRDIFGGGERGVEDECQKEFTFEYQIPKEDLETLLQDGKFEIEFFDTNFVDCCCKAERKISLEYEYLLPLSASCSASPNPAKVNQNVTFSAQVSGGTGNYTYLWSGACSGVSLTCQTTFSSPGTYKANLEVKDGNQTAQTSCEVTIEAQPAPTQKCEKFISNGSAQDKLDFVFIPDGYSSEEENDYLSATLEVANYLLSLSPFKEESCKFNFYRVRGVFDFRGRDAFAANNPNIAKVYEPINTVANLCGISPEEIQVVVNFQKQSGILGWHYTSFPLAYIPGRNLNLPFPKNSGHISYHEFGHDFGLPDHSNSSECPGTYCSHCAMCYGSPQKTYGTTCQSRKQGICALDPCMSRVQNALGKFPSCGGEDTTPPVISDPKPSGVISEKSPTLSVKTNERATCKFDLQDKDYDLMSNTFNKDGTETYHTKQIGPLSDGTYIYYVRCKDSAGNKNQSSVLIKFEIKTTPILCESIEKNGDSSKKIDVVFVGNGYTNLEEFKNDTLLHLQSIFKAKPLNEYRSAFNFWRVNKIDENLECTYSGRVIICNKSKVLALLSNCPFDIGAVIHNNTQRGGGGCPSGWEGGKIGFGEYMTTYKFGYTIDNATTPHEFGHCICCKDDYLYNPQPPNECQGTCVPGKCERYKCIMCTLSPQIWGGEFPYFSSSMPNHSQNCADLIKNLLTPYK